MQHLKGNILKALAFPVVLAESKNVKDQPEKSLIKPSELPLYDMNDSDKYEYWVSEPSQFEEGIEVCRKEIVSLYSGTKYYTDQLCDIYEVGKAHTMTSIDFIKDEENVVGRAGIIGVGGLLGLLVGMRKKGLIRKLFYTSVGAGGVTAALHPAIAKDISMQGYEEARNYANIGYNFIVGVGPEKISESALPKLPTLTKPVVEVPQPIKDVMKDSAVMNASPKKKPAIEPDFGQSNPADRDMYTTRS